MQANAMANAGNFSSRGQADIRKLRLSLPNSRKIFNVEKLQRAQRDDYFNNKRKICLLLLRKATILTRY